MSLFLGEGGGGEAIKREWDVGLVKNMKIGKHNLDHKSHQLVAISNLHFRSSLQVGPIPLQRLATVGYIVKFNAPEDAGTLQYIQ